MVILIIYIERTREDIVLINDYVSNLPILSHLTNRQLNEISENIILNKYKAGEDIANSCECSIPFSIIISGKVKIVNYDRGKYKDVELERDDMFGSV